jgi:ferredoxin
MSFLQPTLFDMKIDNVKMVYYSPTGTTKQMLGYIAEGIAADAVENIDLTSPKASAHEVSADLTIIGVPVYGGRVPPHAVERLKKVKGDDSLAVAVVVYGHRAYEDALIELKDLSVEICFKPIAGGAFVVEHSWSNKDAPIGAGRPEESDITRAKEFGRKIREKVEAISPLQAVELIEVPGNYPYKEKYGNLAQTPVSPSTLEDICIKCGKCVEVCPTGAISMGENIITNAEDCTRCHACIKYCPTGARVFPEMDEPKQYMTKNYNERKEPETFL